MEDEDFTWDEKYSFKLFSDQSFAAVIIITDTFYPWSIVTSLNTNKIISQL